MPIHEWNRNIAPAPVPPELAHNLQIGMALVDKLLPVLETLAKHIPSARAELIAHLRELRSLHGKAIR